MLLPSACAARTGQADDAMVSNLLSMKKIQRSRSLWVRIWVAGAPFGFRQAFVDSESFLAQGGRAMEALGFALVAFGPYSSA